MELHFKGLMFGKLTNGGHIQVYVCVEDEELTVTKTQKKRGAPWTQIVSYKGKVYENIDEVKKLMKNVQINMTLEKRP